jgi:hypothetical protein
MSDVLSRFSFAHSEPDETPDECRTCDLKVCPHEYDLEACYAEDDRYDCPIHGLQAGPDCPRC